jgi:hypothetical protein
MTTFLILNSTLCCFRMYHAMTVFTHKTFAFISLPITVASVYILSLLIYISSNCHLHLVLHLQCSFIQCPHLTVPPVVANTQAISSTWTWLVIFTYKYECPSIGGYYYLFHIEMSATISSILIPNATCNLL